jgi:hypothetical protein
MQSLLLTQIIDRACPPLVERIRQSRMPREMRVNPMVFDCVSSIRAREIVDGYPLMFLGMELVASEAIPVDGFELVD